jgi:DNA-binding transcriptional LysR family regulator
MERLDLRLVEYFVVLAEELHFSRAAARLHIAQPSLSQQIRRLEELLGVTLLERTSRRVELTAAGETLLLEGRRVLRQSSRAIQAVRNTGAEQLTVGFYGSAASALLADVLAAFAEHHPRVHVSLRELLLGDIDQILNGEVDVAFTRLAPDQAEIAIEIIAREPRVVAIPVDHPLAARESVSFADLRTESFITNPAVMAAGPPARWLLEQRTHGLPGRVAAEANSIQEILMLVATGRGIALVPELVASEHRPSGVSFVNVSDAEPALVSLAWRAEDATPATLAFIEIARHCAERRVAATDGEVPESAEEYVHG